IARGTRTTPVILRDHIGAGFFDPAMQRGVLQRSPFDQDVWPIGRNLLMHSLEPVKHAVGKDAAVFRIESADHFDRGRSIQSPFPPLLEDVPDTATGSIALRD